MRIRSGVADQIFNSSEKRLARDLLLMTGIEEIVEIESMTSEITEQNLAEMIRAPKSSGWFAMNRFTSLDSSVRKARRRVCHSLLSMTMHDRLHGNNIAMPDMVHPGR
jgi:hypothetical protein